METLLVTPSEHELIALAESLGASVSGKVGRIHALYVPDLQLTLATGGQGKAQFGLQTQHLLDWGSFGFVICAGVCTALDGALSVGDVVAGETTIEHDFKAESSVSALPRFLGDAVALTKLRGLSTPTKFALHIGGIAGGDEDITDPARTNELQRVTGAIAAAWEGPGCARASKFSGVPFLELRGVARVGEVRTKADFEANVEIAMGNVGQLLPAICHQAS